ncbi:MAG: hypothetical protein RIS36_917 [Pseudomonadota bacterium]
MLTLGNRTNRGEARLESSVPRFYLNHYDGVTGDSDDVGLKAFSPPITDEHDRSVFIKEAAGNAFAPSTARVISYEPTASRSPPSRNPCCGTMTPANVLRCTRHGPNSIIAFLWAGVG